MRFRRYLILYRGAMQRALIFAEHSPGMAGAIISRLNYGPDGRLWFPRDAKAKHAIAREFYSENPTRKYTRANVLAHSDTSLGARYVYLVYLYVKMLAICIYIYIYICKSLISITRYQDSSCLSHRSDNALQIRVTLSYPEAYSVSRIYRARLDSLLEQIAGYPRPCWVAARHLSSLAGCVSLSKRSAASSFPISWRIRQLEFAELKLPGAWSDMDLDKEYPRVEPRSV